MENTESQSFEHKFGGLTEDEVKRRFVPFLKDFYKHRYEPEAGSFSVHFDNVSESGLVADIVMTFKKKDETPFVCACEATSRDKIGEVKYDLNLVYFLWDAAAFGAFCSAAAYGFFYKTQMEWLFNLRLTGNFGLIIGTFIIGFFGWYFTMQGWKKYRYIFAIEQFKRYEADEQWIALADDVFLSPNDPYLIELKNPCVYNGFGLALVPAEGAVRTLNAPSRLGIFGKDRNMVEWVTRSQWYQKVSETMPPAKRLTPPDMALAYWNKLKSWAKYLAIEPFKKYVWSVLSRPFNRTASAYGRFMTGQTVQKWIFVFSTIALAPMFYEIMTFTEEESASLEALKRGPNGENPEDKSGGVLDDRPIEFARKPAGGVTKQYPIYRGISPEEESAPPRNLNGLREWEQEEYVGPTLKPAKTAQPVPSADPCAKLGDKKGWIVQEEGNYDLQNEAASWAGTLRNRGGIKNAYPIPRSCFEIGAQGFIVYLGGVYKTEAEAQSAAAEFEKVLGENGIAMGKRVVVKI